MLIKSGVALLFATTAACSKAPVDQGTPTPSLSPAAKDTAVPLPTFSKETHIDAITRLQKVAKDTTEVSPSIRDAFEATTNAFSGIRLPDGKFQRLRTLAFSETTTEQLLRLARLGEAKFDFNHPGVICEYAFLRDLAGFPKDMRDGLLDTYAQAVVDGLGNVYDRNAFLAVALEIGHMSKPPLDKINKINEDRKRRGVLPLINPTEDTGTSNTLREGGVVQEREVNLQVSFLIALKIMEQYPKWFPILNCKQEGFPVDRLDDTVPDLDEYYIKHRDSIITMKYKWEKMAQKLQDFGAQVVRIANHFNGADDPSLRGGMVITPNFGSQAQKSLKIAEAIATSLTTRVSKYDKSYQCRVADKLNDIKEPYWDLDSYDGDDPSDIKAGNVAKITGAANRQLARIRCHALHRTDCDN